VSELEAVLSSMTEGLLILDGEGRIVSLNPPARAMFGPVGSGITLGVPLDREQLGNWPLGARAVAEALTPVLEALRRGEAQRDLEVEINNQGRQVLSFSSAPLSDAAGHLAGGVVVFRDVTTQRDVARLKDDLLSIASHDLRTPVTVLKVQAQLMRRELDQGVVSTERLASRAQVVLEQTNRLTDMLNLLLDLSRVEAGRLDLSQEPIDLVDLIRRVAANIQPLSTAHHIQVSAPASVDGLWDVARLEQVMQNLLTNAIKYAPDGGQVVISVETDRRQVTVSVRDQGLGIAPEELPQLFERFYRVAGMRGLEGSGLGLYICQGIISAHGGRIWAASDGPGQGSTFSFTLPRAPRAA
jgi:signal transduction histidine kinase